VFCLLLSSEDRANPGVIRYSKVVIDCNSSGNCLFLNSGLVDIVNKGTFTYVTKRGEGNAEDGNGNEEGLGAFRMRCRSAIFSSLPLIRLVGYPMFVFVCQRRLAILCYF
jgi:hypothetical protein